MDLEAFARRASWVYNGGMAHCYKLRKDPATGVEFVEVPFRGHTLIEDPLLNKGTAWPRQEREELGLVGLLPPHISTADEQEARAYDNYCRKESDIERFVFLQALQDRNEVLFYRLLLHNLEEMLGVIYTPTVGQACKDFHHIFRRTRGLYLTAENCSRTAELVPNAVHTDSVEVAVVTDGERILGLGDLGTNGMGIPIGKLSLYVAAGGFNPAGILPVVLDVGTNNEAIRSDPLYLGTRRPRLAEEAYFQAVDQFVAGFKKACPEALLQFEDFAKANAFRHLESYRNDVRCFNDDIQGTGAVALAAILAASRHLEVPLERETLLIVGSGGAGVGIARAFRNACGPSGDETPGVFLRDSRGVVIGERDDLEPFKREFAVERERLRALGLEDPRADLTETIAALRPTVLIGVTGKPGLFDRAVIQALAAGTEFPLVLPLSNPTASSEATPEQILQWSGGRALVATGSPFPPVTWRNETRVVGQCNNVFIFPGLGLGTKISRARRVTDSMLTAAARALSDTVSHERLKTGSLLPPVTEIRDITARVAAAVAQAAIDSEVAEPRGCDWEGEARTQMWIPQYLPYRYHGDLSS